MSILDEITKDLVIAEQHLNICKEEFLAKKKELVEIETFLVEAKENYYKLIEKIRLEKLTSDFSDFEDPRRDLQIKTLKDNLPLLNKIINR